MTLSSAWPCSNEMIKKLSFIWSSQCHLEIKKWFSNKWGWHVPCLMLIIISKGKGLYKVTIRFVSSSRHSFNLGSHYVLLEAPSDLWVLIYIKLIVNIEWTYRIAHERSGMSFISLLSIRLNVDLMCICEFRLWLVWIN